MKTFQKGGPPVNSEFYPGWLAHWQEPHPKVKSADVVNQVKSMLSLNASFSFYMFHGGTNFGFTSGANTNESDANIGYLPQLTSYDYDAPITEAGDLTEKYFRIKETLENAVSLITFHSPMRKSKLLGISIFRNILVRYPTISALYHRFQCLKQPMAHSTCGHWLVYLKKLLIG